MSERRTAFIGAALGALVGGVFSLGGTWLTLHDQATRESEAQHRVAVGTARVMIAAFDNAVRYLCRVGGESGFIVVTPKLRPEVSTTDRELVAGELTVEEALSVAEGDLAMATWEELYPELRKRHGRRDETFNPYSYGLNRAIERAMGARVSLERTAEYGATGRRVCDTDAWELTIAQ